MSKDRILEKDEEIKNYGKLLLEDARKLAEQQSSVERNYAMEHATADRTMSEIRHLIHNWHPDFAPTAKVIANDILYSDFYPPNTIRNRPELLQFMADHGFTFDLKAYSQTELQTYLGGFQTGLQLGYQKELGDKWFLTLADNSGSYYVPVEKITGIIGIGS